MPGYKEILRPIVELIDSEQGHHLARATLHTCENIPFAIDFSHQVLTGRKRFSDPRLNTNIAGIFFDNPIMVGAGWDKNAEAIKALYDLGFAGVEVGTVLPREQDGNPKPRQFRIAPGISLNRLGFNSKGMLVVIRNLQRYQHLAIPIGGSVGKHKETPDIYAPEDHANVTRALLPYVDYIAINVSSPNTKGLRRLQGKGPLRDNAQAVNGIMDQTGRRKPRFIKIAPDLSFSAIDDVIEVVKDEGFDGIIATNTTINPDIKSKYGSSWGGSFDGGLAGDDPEYRQLSTNIIRHIHQTDKGIYILGVGGIKDGPTALEKILAGATVVQIVTGIWSEGPFVPLKINRWLVNYMVRNGVRNIQELVGQAA